MWPNPKFPEELLKKSLMENFVLYEILVVWFSSEYAFKRWSNPWTKYLRETLVFIREIAHYGKSSTAILEEVFLCSDFHFGRKTGPRL